jgi:hypothetical protein
METKEEFQVKLRALIEDTDQMIKEAQTYLTSQGKIIDLPEDKKIQE